MHVCVPMHMLKIISKSLQGILKNGFPLELKWEKQVIVHFILSHLGMQIITLQIISSFKMWSFLYWILCHVQQEFSFMME